MNTKQVESINELCEIYHRIDFDRKTDAAVITLLLSLLGYAPVGDMPQTVQGSINAFRHIGHQERYTFSMTAIATLLEFPSRNSSLREIFNHLMTSVEPVKDVTGRVVIECGKLNFGSYNCTPLSALIFCKGSQT